MAASRTLILMRHAAAGHQGGHRDHDRQLTPGGTRDATAAGEWIRRSLPAVDAVLCSTAVRTRQTLAATGVIAPAGFVDVLYGGGVDDILEQVAKLPESARTALLIGHAPGIPSTAYELVTAAARTSGDDEPAERPEWKDLRRFSAGSVAVLTTEASWSELAERGADLLTVRPPNS